jgi:hypothetical protein
MMPVAMADTTRIMISSGTVGMLALFLVTNPKFVSLMILELKKGLWIFDIYPISEARAFMAKCAMDPGLFQKQRIIERRSCRAKEHEY